MNPVTGSHSSSGYACSVLRAGCQPLTCLGLSELTAACQPQLLWVLEDLTFNELLTWLQRKLSVFFIWQMKIITVVPASKGARAYPEERS